jgi:CRISPR-associated endonuclease/helicase Cas3
MTSLEEHTGRPEVAPWIRGWIEEEPQTTVVWREILPVASDGTLLSEKLRDAYFEAASPHMAERLEERTPIVARWLRSRLQAVQKRASERTTLSTSQEAQSDQEDSGETSQVLPGSIAQPRAVRRSETLAVIRMTGDRCISIGADFKEDDKRDRFESLLAGATVIVDARLGGLAVIGHGEATGLLDETDDFASDVTVVQPKEAPRVPFRISRVQADGNMSGSADQTWREEARIPMSESETGDELEWIVIESWSSASAETEEGRAVSAKREQLLDDHQEWAEREAARLASRLNLPTELSAVLTTAARLHDEGKRAARWQRAFGKPGKGEPYAKTKNRPNIALLGGYRHELGSLPLAEANAKVQALSSELRDLCLHMIAAHHGRARPLMPTSGADAPPSVLEQRAQEIALRFSRLGQQWGSWGLAWWEALLRAADQKASRDNDERSEDHG